MPRFIASKRLAQISGALFTVLFPVQGAKKDEQHLVPVMGKKPQILERR